MTSESKDPSNLEDKKAKYDPLFPPRPYGKEGLRDREAVLKILPLEKLPKAFYPEHCRPFRPPVYYLGYFVTDEWCINVAKENGLYGTMIVEGKEGWNEDVDSVLSHIVKTTGITTFHPKRKPVAWPLDYPPGWCLAIYSNYQHREPFGTPSAEDIDKLRVFLKKEERPRWWLSLEYSKWAVRPIVIPY